MTDNQSSQNEEEAKQELADELRRAVSSAYAFVRGQETNDSFLAITFEEVLDQQIERIEGEGTALRPNVLDRITKLKEDILAAVESIKAQPDDFFKAHDDAQDAVTDPVPEDPLDKTFSA